MTRLYAAGLAMALAVAGYLWWEHRTEQKAVEQERARVEHQAEMQRLANSTRARDAERLHNSQTVYRDRFITKTATEIRYVTQNLAGCVLSPAAVGMLNDAAKCASEDRPASCGAGDAVRPPV